MLPSERTVTGCAAALSASQRPSRQATLLRMHVLPVYTTDFMLLAPVRMPPSNYNVVPAFAIRRSRKVNG
ncbi:hypothetical protein RmaAA213_09960 [Rhodothermus marinus]|nr:hypothetical protein RmaAA213_09960 [Rhodothermus marinus]BBM72143.1 hypothetical protein RmaAA338_10080 [Rhodothermus marinus]